MDWMDMVNILMGYNMAGRIGPALDYSVVGKIIHKANIRPV
jgi:hypothetical protein